MPRGTRRDRITANSTKSSQAVREVDFCPNDKKHDMASVAIASNPVIASPDSGSIHLSSARMRHIFTTKIDFQEHQQHGSIQLIFLDVKSIWEVQTMRNMRRLFTNTHSADSQMQILDDLLTFSQNYFDTRNSVI